MPPQPSVSPLGAMLPPQQQQQIKMEIDDSWRTTKPSTTTSMPQIFNQPPPAIINSGPPPLGATSEQSVITNETPKIGICPNNRIFVDGRAYEVS